VPSRRAGLALDVALWVSGLWRGATGGVPVGGAFRFAAEGVEAEDLLVPAREPEQFAVEWIERVVGVADAGHVEVLRLWRWPVVCRSRVALACARMVGSAVGLLSSC
jgi:hypothetical protein